MDKQYTDLRQLTGELVGILQHDNKTYICQWAACLGKMCLTFDGILIPDGKLFTAERCRTPKETMALICKQYDKQGKHIWRTWKLDNGDYVTVETSIKYKEAIHDAINELIELANQGIIDLTITTDSITEVGQDTITYKHGNHYITARINDLSGIYPALDDKTVKEIKRITKEINTIANQP